VAESDSLLRAALSEDPVDVARLTTPETFWSQRCTGLEETDVDSVFYSTTMGFNLHTHDSKVAELFTTTIGPFGDLNLTAAWIEKGRDCLQLIIDFCRKHEKEVFWSLRMNDGHDNWFPNTCCCEFKKQHPELLLFQPKDIGRVRPNSDWPEPYLRATAVDYGRQEIRDQEFAIIEDVCRRYDIDGIELDFLRNPIYFRPTLECRPCEPEHLEIMTGFIRRLREMTEQVGQERNRPLLIACRVPSRIDCCRKIGFDIEQWLTDDLIDVVVSSLEDDPFTGPAKELTELGHRYNAPVYACLQGASPGLDPSASWAGAATNAWNAGIDGIYTFNNFTPRGVTWSVIGNPAELAKQDKAFAVDNLGKGRGKEHVYPREGRLPIDLSLGEVSSIVLPVGDDVAARAGNGEVRRLILSIYVDQMTYSDEIEFKLNDRVLETEIIYTTNGISPVVCSNFLLRTRPDPSSVRKGDNQFTAFLKKRCESAPGVPAISGLALVVKYKR
jgi:hypothetical protein